MKPNEVWSQSISTGECGDSVQYFLSFWSFESDVTVPGNYPAKFDNGGWGIDTAV